MENRRQKFAERQVSESEPIEANQSVSLFSAQLKEPLTTQRARSSYDQQRPSISSFDLVAKDHLPISVSQEQLSVVPPCIFKICSTCVQAGRLHSDIIATTTTTTTRLCSTLHHSKSLNTYERWITTTHQQEQEQEQQPLQLPVVLDGSPRPNPRDGLRLITVTTTRRMIGHSTTTTPPFVQTLPNFYHRPPLRPCQSYLELGSFRKIENAFKTTQRPVRFVWNDFWMAL